MFVFVFVFGRSDTRPCFKISPTITILSIITIHWMRPTLSASTSFPGCHSMSGKYIRALTIRRFLSLMAIIRFTQHRRKVQLYRKLITFVIPSCKITVKLFGRDSVDWESKGFVTKVKDQVKLLYFANKQKNNSSKSF